MKKKFGRALRGITADIAAAPDISDSNSDGGNGVQRMVVSRSNGLRHHDDDRFGYEKEKWEEMEEEEKEGVKKY